MLTGWGWILGLTITLTEIVVKRCSCRIATPTRLGTWSDWRSQVAVAVMANDATLDLYLAAIEGCGYFHSQNLPHSSEPSHSLLCSITKRRPVVAKLSNISPRDYCRLFICRTWLSQFDAYIIYSDSIDRPSKHVVPCCGNQTRLGGSIATAQLKMEHTFQDFASRFPDRDFYIYSDDDVYWSTDALANRLSALHHRQVSRAGSRRAVISGGGG